jgi:flagellar basal-body rod protein FlgC
MEKYGCKPAIEPRHGERVFTTSVRGRLSLPWQDGRMDSTDVISVTGLTAAQTQLQVSASNLANMDDSAPLPGSGVQGPAPFVPTRVETVSLGSGGVQAQLSASTSASTPAYEPDSPYADSPGMVAKPDVDPVGETVSRMQALQQYRASAAMIEADDRMQKAALHMLS